MLYVVDRNANASRTGLMFCCIKHTVSLSFATSSDEALQLIG